MYNLTAGNTSDFPDVEAFAGVLTDLDHHDDPSLRDFFDDSGEVIITRAPGRLDVMGGIADYSGSLVLQMPIREATLVALQERADRVLQIVSLRDGQGDPVQHTMALEDFENGDGTPITYDQGQELFSGSDHSWAAYVAGVFLVLMRDRGVEFSKGANILVSSRVPEAMGVSSSAALEVATMQAVAAAQDMDLESRDLAILCQRVENLVVGAPCGVMDQISSSCGEAGKLLALLCQPAELCGHVSIPDDISFYGIDSGIRHSVSGSDYSSVRVGAFMGYRIVAHLAGLEVLGTDESGALRIEDPHWSGYLANLTPSEFDQQYFQAIPAELTGADFLAQYAGTTDSVTRVEPDRKYAVRVPTRHPIAENFRVGAFSKMLDGAAKERRLEMLGELMYQSHASYSACGLGSVGTDRIVELVREQGPRNGLYGAKITGGGSGGTVAVLARRDADSAVQQVAERYAGETGHDPMIFSGSSPGAGGFGHVRMRRG
jgi:L-arabinokinase